MVDGLALVEALKHNPDIIPRASYPQSVYFLLNLSNFQQAWDMWLGYSLELRGYNVRF